VKLQAGFILLCFVLSIQLTAAQNATLYPEECAEVLDKKDFSVIDSIRMYSLTINKMDSLQAFQFLDKLADEGKSKGGYFRARFNIIKGSIIYTKKAYRDLYYGKKPHDLNLVREELMKLYKDAIDIAYQSEDEFLVAYVSYASASVMNTFGETGFAVMYSKNGIDLYEKIGYPVLPEYYQFLSELLFKVREYNQSIYYGRKAVATWQKTPNDYPRAVINVMNTVALGYHRQKIYDSALHFYDQAFQMATQTNDTIWKGIVSGNRGQLFYELGKYDSAYALLKMDYEISKKGGFYDNAANSLQWAARANLALGNKTAALAEVREAFQVLRLWPNANYLKNTYYTSTQVFKELGMYDSAFYYNNLYAAINDSLEKVVATSSLAISKARLNDETSRYNIQNLNKEKRSQLLLRNIIIASIVVLSIIVVLAVNRQRLKEKLKTGKAEQEKLRMQQEVASAKQQLEMFTANIIEKTSLVEKLESQIRGKEATTEQNLIITELSQQTILTEEDWNKFKSLFDKIYPGFFINLKEKFPDITVAEQRMAALTRLQLTPKQMASMLGISVDSVHKTRQRLRQRLHIGPDSSLEEIMPGI